MQAAAFPYHNVDTFYRHLSHVGNHLGEALGERPLLVVAPAFADVALNHWHGRRSFAVVASPAIIGDGSGFGQCPASGAASISLAPCRRIAFPWRQSGQGRL
jgi:hypothetical protein